MLFTKNCSAPGLGEFKWIDAGNNSITAFQQTDSDETVLAIHKLSEASLSVLLELKKPANKLTDLLTKRDFAVQVGRLALALTAGQYLWLKSLMSLQA
jgi:hypothetical protein